MRKTRSLLVLLLLPLVPGCAAPEAVPSQPPADGAVVSLPEPRLTGDVSLEQALLERRSVRDYADEPVSVEDLSQLLWAAQGVTADWGGRTAPSAGALYPLEVEVVAVRVSGLDPGAYRYVSGAHHLVPVHPGDITGEVLAASGDQGSVGDAAAVLVISAVYERTTAKYGERGIRYVHMEAGHAAQNVYLQVTALGLGCVVIGAFDEDRLSEALGLPEDETPLYLIPVGVI